MNYEIDPNDFELIFVNANLGDILYRALEVPFMIKYSYVLKFHIPRFHISAKFILGLIFSHDSKKQETLHVDKLHKKQFKK